MSSFQPDERQQMEESDEIKKDESFASKPPTPKEQRNNEQIVDENDNLQFDILIEPEFQEPLPVEQIESNNQEQDSVKNKKGKKKVQVVEDKQIVQKSQGNPLDHIVRITIPSVPMENENDSYVVPFFRLYNNYLEEHDLYEVENMAEQRVEIDKQTTTLDKRKHPDAIDLEEEEDSDMVQQKFFTQGKQTFDQMLKSMIARLEFGGTLDKKQRYGRHNNPKGAKKGQVDQEKKQDENFYDLDDEFIDDENMDELEDAHLDSGSNVSMAQEQREKDPDEESIEDEHYAGPQELLIEEEGQEEEEDEDEKEIKRVLSKFKTLSPEQIQEMFRQDAEEKEKAKQLAQAQQQIAEGEAKAPFASAFAQPKPPKDKKRKYIQISNVKNDHEVSVIINDLIEKIKAKAEKSEFFGDTKKQLSELVNRVDPGWYRASVDVAKLLAQSLGKSEAEILYNLKKTYYCEAKKKSMAYLEKAALDVGDKLQKDMIRAYNKLFNTEVIDLPEFEYKLGREMNLLCSHMGPIVQDYIDKNDKFLEAKEDERLVKAKRVKGEGIKKPQDKTNFIELWKWVFQTHVLSFLDGNLKAYMLDQILNEVPVGDTSQRSEPMPAVEDQGVKPEIGNIWNVVVAKRHK